MDHTDINTARTRKEVVDKLLARGVETLSDEELLSIVIREGTPSMTAVEQSRRVLSEIEGGISGLSRITVKNLRMIGGLGVNKAVMIMCAFELGRRFADKETVSVSVVRDSADIIRMFKPKLSVLPHEEFWAVFLSSANTVLDRIRISHGGVASTTADPKIILKKAVELLASAIILVHNHPSGLCEPSDSDVVLTRKIAESASLFDIAVHDHIIITTGRCYSFREEGML